MKLTTTTNVSVDGVMQGLGEPDEDRRGGFERGGWARNTASSCRNTAFSTSSAATDEPPLNTRTSLRTTTYIKKNTTGGSYGPLSVDANQDFRALQAASSGSR